MALKTWTIADTARGGYLEHLTVGPADAGGSARGYSVNKRALRAGPSQGVDVVEVDNGKLRFTVLPTRGMGIWKAALGDLDLAWKSPVRGPVHPSLVHLWDPNGLGWLEGFDEMLVRCGLENNGSPESHPNGTLRYPLHGKIANIPAHHVEVSIDGDSGEITVAGVVDETRLFGAKLRLSTRISTRAGQPSLTVTDVVSNLSGEPGDFELLYHINFGVPLLGPGAKVVLPVAKLAPRDAVAVGNLAEWDTYGREAPGVGEAVFFAELAAGADGRTMAMLRNAASQRGVSIRFNKRQLPCFSLWKNRQAAADGYVTGLEPGVNFPNRKSFEKQQGRVVALAPGESRTFEVTIEGHADAASVAAAEAAVAKLQQGAARDVRKKPDPAWSKG